MTWPGLKKHAALVLLALYAGIPGGTCLVECVVADVATELEASSNHCSSEPSVGTSAGPCHTSLDAPDAALRAEYRLAAIGAPVLVEGSFSLVRRRAGLPGAGADERAAAHGPPGTRFPLRV